MQILIVNIRKIFLGGNALSGCGVGFADLCNMSIEQSELNRISGAKLNIGGNIGSTYNGDIFINPTGNSGMATAGSGDVLTGIIAGLLAQGMPSKWATLSGCYLHGLAGDQFVEKQSKTNLIASDLLRELPNTIKSIFP